MKRPRGVDGDIERARTPIEIRLDVNFKDIALLELAVTHASLTNNTMSYERLEFVGDRVLGLAMAEMLYKRFPTESEGYLTRRHSQLVRSETLAAIARNLNLGEHIRMDSSEESTGGREKESLLADVVEAIIAAIYFDQGLSAAKDFIEKNWEPYLDEPLFLGFKTILQEAVQAKGFAVPTYETTGTKGPAHAPVFTIVVVVEGLGVAEGIGTSKRKAGQAAAENFLEKHKDKLEHQALPEAAPRLRSNCGQWGFQMREKSTLIKTEVCNKKGEDQAGLS